MISACRNSQSTAQEVCDGGRQLSRMEDGAVMSVSPSLITRQQQHFEKFSTPPRPPAPSCAFKQLQELRNPDEKHRQESGIRIRDGYLFVLVWFFFLPNRSLKPCAHTVTCFDHFYKMSIFSVCVRVCVRACDDLVTSPVCFPASVTLIEGRFWIFQICFRCLKT